MSDSTFTASNGLTVVKRSMNAAELAEWRKRNPNRAVSDVQTAPVESVEFDKPAPQMPLDGPDTMRSLLDDWLTHMRGSRENYQRAMRWVRLREPSAVSHMTDQQLYEHLRHIAEQASKRVEARLGRPSRDQASGRYAVR